MTIESTQAIRYFEEFSLNLIAAKLTGDDHFQTTCDGYVGKRLSQCFHALLEAKTSLPPNTQRIIASTEKFMGQITREDKSLKIEAPIELNLLVLGALLIAASTESTDEPTLNSILDRRGIRNEFYSEFHEWLAANFDSNAIGKSFLSVYEVEVAKIVA